MLKKTALWVPVFLSVLFVSSAQAEGDSWRFKDGRWRLEFNGTGATYSGKTSRGGDFIITGSAEYEFPIYARTTLGLRTYPLFYYHQNVPAKEIFGAGAGIATRVYQNKDTLDGWYGEGGASMVWHSNYIEKNSSRVNFMLEAGIGYQFPESDWHVALKFTHISNGSMGSKNTGSNGFGLAVGYTF